MGYRWTRQRGNKRDSLSVAWNPMQAMDRTASTNQNRNDEFDTLAVPVSLRSHDPGRGKVNVRWQRTFMKHVPWLYGISLVSRPSAVTSCKTVGGWRSTGAVLTVYRSSRKHIVEDARRFYYQVRIPIRRLDRAGVRYAGSGSDTTTG